MSTIKVASVQHPSAASAAVALDANGQATLNGLAYPTSGSLSGRNRIINGDMRIDQRNAGAAVTGISNGAAFAADRFTAYNQIAGTISVQQVTDAPAGFSYSNKITATTAGSTGTAAYLCFMQHKIEGFNIADLGAGTSSAQTITLSFWVKSSVTGTMSVAFANDNNRTYVSTYTVNSANTWEQKSITVALPTGGTWNATNGRGLLISWTLGAGSTYTTSTLNSWQNVDGIYCASGAASVGATLNATWQLTGVQLEAGSVATPFERRSYGQELALCQRYFQLNTAAVGYTIATTVVSAIISGNATMRATPSVAVFSGTNKIVDYNIAARNASSVTGYGGSANGIEVSIVVSSTTNGKPHGIYPDAFSLASEL